MRGEHVEPEVGLGVAPRRVRVVDVALRVVPLDEQPRALQPVVVPLAGASAARPREVDGVERGVVGVAAHHADLLGHPVQVGARAADAGARAARRRTRRRAGPSAAAMSARAAWSSSERSASVVDRVAELLQRRLLYAGRRTGARQMSTSESTRSPSDSVVRLPPMMSPGAFGSSSARSASGADERAHQVARDVLGARERAQQRAHQRGDAGSAPRNDGVDATTAPVDDQVRHRHVVPAEPPAPRRRARRVAEHPQVVQAGVAAALAVEHRGEALGVVEDVLQAHHRRRGDVARPRRARAQQRHRQPLLGGALGVQGEAAVVGRRVEPAAALGVALGVGVGARPDRHGALLLGERVEPGQCGGGHACGDHPCAIGSGFHVR